MSTTYFRLMERHARIDDELRRERQRKIPDPFVTLRLKKLKLVIKDRMAALIRRGIR